MDKQKYLDYDGVKLFKKNLMIEDYNNKILETCLFNNISDFSILTTTSALDCDFEDSTNYNLITITFPKIDMTDELLFMINLKAIFDGSQKEIYRKFNLSDFIIKDDEISCVIDATKTGIGDYLLSDISKMEELKNTGLIATLLSCQILDINNYNHEENLIINGVNNRISSKDLIIVNGENNDVYGDRTRSLYVSGKNNDIKNSDYGLSVGINNKENKAGLGLTIGANNKKDCTDYSTILGARNTQLFGTYIPKSKWTNYNVNTSVIPAIITLKFSISSDFNYLQGKLPSVGDTISAHTFYGIRETTIEAIECDSNNTVTLTFKSVDSAENDATLQWGNYVNIHGIMFTHIGYSKNNSFIAGEYNSSYSYGSGILGFGNGTSGNYSFISGRHNQVLGEHASAFGWGNIISSDNALVSGSFNKDEENAIFIIGNGANKFDRSNALSLLNNGQLTVAGDLKYNGQTSLSEKITSIENKLPTHSSTKPTIDGSIGDIVYNENPTQGSYVGWIYTPSGWLGFGKIEASGNENIPENAYTLADGSAFTLADGSVFVYADN